MVERDGEFVLGQHEAAGCEGGGQRLDVRRCVPVDSSAPEMRVLGALLEKQRTTPDAYPLSLNALRAATNQATNRDPVVDYDDATIRDALHRLSRRRWTRLASGPGSRAAKYRHLVDEALGLGPSELSVLTVLMLRGPQTPGELRARTERLYAFADAEALHAALDTLIDRELAARLPRRPGQKEERYMHLLSDEEEQPGVPAAAVSGAPARPAAAAPDVDDMAAPGARPPVAAPPPAAPTPDPRVASLEDEVHALRADLDALRASLDALRAELGA